LNPHFLAIGEELGNLKVIPLTRVFREERGLTVEGFLRSTARSILAQAAANAVPQTIG
jgi:cytochrome c-type biogenesis protein CcmE